MTKWDEEEATGGDPVAAFLVGRRSRTPSKRSKWFKAAASAGFARAQNELAQLLRDGARGVARDAPAARALLEEAAAANEPEAIYNLGTLVAASGDESAAFALFKKAASLGVSDAAFNVGASFYSGKGGVKKNLVIAAKWFDRARGAKGLLFSAYCAIALGYPDVSERLARAASAGSVEARNMLMNHPSFSSEL